MNETCPKCGGESLVTDEDGTGLMGCFRCGWKEGDPMPIPDGSRIERLVIALIGSPNKDVRLVSVVELAVQINEKIKQAESGVPASAAKTFASVQKEWPGDE